MTPERKAALKLVMCQRQAWYDGYYIGFNKAVGPNSEIVAKAARELYPDPPREARVITCRNYEYAVHDGVLVCRPFATPPLGWVAVGVLASEDILALADLLKNPYEPD